MDETQIGAVTWEAPEHHHIEKGANWYWVLGIVAIAGAAAAIILGNTLFGVVILLGASTMLLFAGRKPRIISFAISPRGIKVGEELFPYSKLQSFHIDEDHPQGPQLLVRSEQTFAPIIVLPLPLEYIDAVDALLSMKLPDEFLEEPLSEKILEFFGF